MVSPDSNTDRCADEFPLYHREYYKVTEGFIVSELFAIQRGQRVIRERI
jgi:hypothetical protein